MTVTFLLGLMGAEVSSNVLPPSCGWADADMVPPRGLPSNQRDSSGADSQAFLLATHSPGLLARSTSRPVQGARAAANEGARVPVMAGAGVTVDGGGRMNRQGPGWAGR